jgi:hypothetical protein
MEPLTSGSTLDIDNNKSGIANAAMLHSSRPHRSFAPVWAIALLCGILASAVAGVAGELAHGAFKPRMYRVEILSLKTLQPSRESQRAADIKNASVAFAILGGITGLAMGLAGGLAVGSIARGLKVGLVALLAGAITGGLASVALAPLFYRDLIPDTNDLLSPILIHGGIWTAIGAVGGIALAFAMGTPKRRLADSVAGACFGAVLATIFYHVVAAGFFPDAKSTDVLANTATVRLLSTGSVLMMVALGASIGAQGGFIRSTSNSGDH